METIVQFSKEMAALYNEQGVSYLENIESCPHYIKFKAALEKFTIEDLNIAYDKKFLFDPEGPLNFMKVPCDPLVGMGIFFFPKGFCFPIHDHPRMFVASKVLDGHMTCHSYNPVDFEKRQRQFDILLEKKQGDADCAKELEEGIVVKDLGLGELKTGDIEWVSPKERNLHTMEVLEDCCMLDVYIPNTSYRHFYTIVEDDKLDKDEKRVRIDLQPKAFRLALLKYDEYQLKKVEA